MPHTFARGKLVVEKRCNRLVFNTGRNDTATLHPIEVKELIEWLKPSLDTRIAQEVMERAAAPDYTPSTNESQAFEAFRRALPAGARWGVSHDNIVRYDGMAIAEGDTLARAFCHAALYLVAQDD